MTLWRWAVDVHSCGMPAAGTARYCSGTRAAGTGLQVLVLRVCKSGIVVCFGVHGCIISHM
eukprot:SAG31_NODE_42183_length_272_cov_1.572254_1_plen_60_part_01